MKKYDVLPRVVLRTPVLPFDVLANWDTDRRAYLRRLVDDPAIREALYVASPELDAQIESWKREPAKHDAVERALVRYITRMSARSTPFGLFSSVAVADVGDESKLELPARCAAQRHTRLDNDFLFALCTDLVRDRGVRRHLRFRPSTSLYEVAGRLRYAEARLAGTVRTYHLVAVDRTSYLQSVLERAAGGATFGELVDVLCTDPEITADDAGGFLDDVIDAQILVPELAPNVTGREPTLEITERLNGPLAPLAEPLRLAANALAEIDAAPPGVPAAAYKQIEALLAVLPTKVEPSRLFQVDLFKPATVTIGQPVIDEIHQAIELLSQISPTGGDPFTQFREKFTARYETREVPLVEVLDEETGIGFGDAQAAANSPLLADLGFPGRAGENRVPMGPRDLHLMKLLANALQSGATEIELTDQDVEALKTPGKDLVLADTLATMAVLLAKSPEAVAAGDFQLRLNVVAPGANILGRFCHGSDEVAALTAQALRAEEAHHPDAVFAEVVHLPEGRHGNVLLRPVLREYEIAFLGASGAADDKQLDITDLTISIDNGRVVLRSKRLNKEVIPRNTTAHNYGARSLTVYRFLCSLATQHLGQPRWSWGAVSDFPFLPRIRRGKVILDRARWLLASTDLAKLTPAGLAALRERLELPRWIVIGDGDNELPVDLDNELMVDSAAHLLKGRPNATIYELLPQPDELALRSPEGGFSHELVALFSRVSRTENENAEPKPHERPVLTEVIDAPRKFLPGSQWLYLKLYTGPATADALLRGYVAPVIEQALATGLVSQWFFIRYGDPDNHLRIRFAGDPDKLTGQLLPLLHAALAQATARGLSHRIVIDTYERELERYGGAHGIELAEQLFCADSDAALAIIGACEGDAGTDAMWRLAFAGVDKLLDDLGLSLAEKLALATAARDAFGAEHGITTAFQKQLGDKYRRHSKELAALLAAAPDGDHLYAPAIAAFAVRSQRLRPLGQRLRALVSAGKLTKSLDDLVHSYVHMHVNRMIRSSQRAHELVLYDLLRRHYDGLVARGKQQLKKTA